MACLLCLKKDHFIQREIPNKPQFNLKGNCSKGNSKCISVQFKGKLFKGKFQMYQICSNLPIRFKEKEKCIVIRNLKETEHHSSRKAEYDKHKQTHSQKSEIPVQYLRVKL